VGMIHDQNFLKYPNKYT